MKKLAALFLCLQLFALNSFAYDVISDDFAEQNLKQYKGQKYDRYSLEAQKRKKQGTRLDYTSMSKAPLKIKPEKHFSSRLSIQEGETINFYTSQPYQLPNGKIIPQGTKVNGILETLSPNEAKGVPADIIVGRFTLPEYPEVSILGQVSKSGANRSLWVYPILSISPLFLFVPLLVAFVRGGHAKLRTRETYIVFVEQ